ncbi:YjgB family protein [Paenibacillus guangzhouensis]|uniref:YjgB family protein n=1 Tax=Paenibacillus guangzhouensis TaxID=1473112 RepID=UPI0012677EDC|nr:YjgB family protein [Paenibacillus guangzhouensis]
MTRNLTLAASLGLTLVVMLSGCGNHNAERSVQSNQIPETTHIVQQTERQPGAVDYTVRFTANKKVASKHDKSVEAVKNMMKQAKQGKVAGSEYGAQTGLFDDVEKDWGKPDTNESAGKGIYATYAKKHIVFGYNKGMQIFDVRSERPEVQSLTLSDVEKALGKPKEVRKSGKDTIYVYPAGEDYELKFVMPTPTKKQPNPHIHHISVYYPRGAVNLMLG